MNACEMFYDPCKSVLQMLKNAVANLTNVLQMKQEHDAFVINLHNTYIAGVSHCLKSTSLCPVSLFFLQICTH